MLDKTRFQLIVHAFGLDRNGPDGQPQLIAALLEFNEKLLNGTVEQHLGKKISRDRRTLQRWVRKGANPNDSSFEFLLSFFKYHSEKRGIPFSQDWFTMEITQLLPLINIGNSAHLPDIMPTLEIDSNFTEEYDLTINKLNPSPSLEDVVSSPLMPTSIENIGLDNESASAPFGLTEIGLVPRKVGSGSWVTYRLPELDPDSLRPVSVTNLHFNIPILEGDEQMEEVPVHLPLPLPV